MKIKSASDCRFDVVSLGECMIRLSPPQHGRIEFSPMLDVWVGGGEYNVAYALARLGLRSGWIGGLNDSPMGAIIRNHARAAGMNVDYVVERKYDGIGNRDRIGLNFTEVGVSQRGGATVYDRGHSVTAGMKPGDVDWKKLFNKDGVRWFHTGGVFSALTDNTRAVLAEAVKAAHDAGTIISYDLNFRSKLWSSQQAIDATTPLMPYIDCLFGNDEAYEKMLGYQPDARTKVVERIVGDFPNLKVVASAIRRTKSATVNDWSGTLSIDGRSYDGPRFDDLEIEDRIGGGDGFASGVEYGFLTGKSPQECVDLGVAHGALVMSTTGDTSQVTLDELLQIAGGGSARIKR